MKTERAAAFLALATFVGMAWVALPASAHENKSPETKLAIVNGQAITQRDFDREFNGVKRRLSSMGKSVKDDQLATLKIQVLENMINLELLFQESQKKGIKIEETAIDEQVNTIKKRFPDEDGFKKALLKMNLSEGDLRSQIIREMSVRQFIDEQFVEKTIVSDKETKSYYSSHQGDFKKSEMVKARHILIKIEPQADDSQKAEARKKIEDIQNRLKKGEDFVSLAKEFSQCPSGAKGGDLGYFTHGQMVKPFSDKAFALAPGEVSNIVETEFGYHIIQSIDKKPATTIAYKDIKEKLQKYLKQKEVMKQVGEYTEDIKRKAKVERFMTED
jgi:peptidyl-prolyl cis-trans isomerase C